MLSLTLPAIFLIRTLTEIQWFESGGFALVREDDRLLDCFDWILPLSEILRLPWTLFYKVLKRSPWWENLFGCETLVIVISLSWWALMYLCHRMRHGLLAELGCALDLFSAFPMIIKRSSAVSVHQGFGGTHLLFAVQILWWLSISEKIARVLLLLYSVFETDTYHFLKLFGTSHTKNRFELSLRKIVWKEAFFALRLVKLVSTLRHSWIIKTLV